MTAAKEALSLVDRLLTILDERRIKDPGLLAVAFNGRADRLSAESQDLWGRATLARKASDPRMARKLARKAQRLASRSRRMRDRADRFQLLAMEGK